MPGQEANWSDLEMSFRSFIKERYAEYSHQNCLNKAILMRQHNIHFHDKIRNIP